jgi:hypothetical protein
MAARLMALHFQYLEIDGVEFDTYWQNGGYKKISDIIFAECHIFIVSNLWRGQQNIVQSCWAAGSAFFAVYSERHGETPHIKT